jgi:hypothetical protein
MNGEEVSAAVWSMKVRCAVCVEVPGIRVRGERARLYARRVWSWEEADALTYSMLTLGH